MLRTPPRVSRKEEEEVETRQNGKESCIQMTKKVLRSPVLMKLTPTQTGVNDDGNLGRTTVDTTVADTQASADMATRKETPGLGFTPGGSASALARNFLLTEKPSERVYNAEGLFTEAFIQLSEGLSAMKAIIKEMEAAIKKQPNVSKAIKISIPKLEEGIDKLQHLAKTWPNSLAKEGGKRSASSPPIMEKMKSAKKVRPDKGARIHTSEVESVSKDREKPNTISTRLAQTPLSGWTIVTKKGFKSANDETTPTAQAAALERDSRQNEAQKTRSAVRNREKPDAILLKPIEGKTYADVLTAIRMKVSPESCGVKVKSLRKTRAGELLVELQKSSTDSRNAFHLALKEAAGEASTVRELVHKVKLEIRDVDDYTSAEEVKVALQNALGGHTGILDISLTRPNERGQRIAIARMEKTAAKLLLQKGKVKIGWVNCSIRSRVEVPKCFKCLGYGHLVPNCAGPDRSNKCFQCGAEGHKAKDCQSHPKCYLCTDKDGNASKHLAGSGACGAFRKALEHARKTEK